MRESKRVRQEQTPKRKARRSFSDHLVGCSASSLGGHQNHQGDFTRKYFWALFKTWGTSDPGRRTRSGRGGTRKQPRPPAHSSVASVQPPRLPCHPDFLFKGLFWVHEAPAMHFLGQLLRFSAGAGGGVGWDASSPKGPSSDAPTLGLPETWRSGGTPLPGRQLFDFPKCPPVPRGVGCWPTVRARKPSCVICMANLPLRPGSSQR